MRDKVIYIISWSALLMIATFPNLFINGDFIESFNVSNTSFNDGKGIFLMPLLFAVLLSGVDVVYLYLLDKSNGQQLDLFKVFVWVLVFLGSLIASIFYSNAYLTAAGFYIAWFSLTGMKFAATKDCAKDTLHKIQES